MNDLQKWIRIRKDLYLQMEKQVRHRLGEDSPELMHYRQTYHREFAKKWTTSTKEELLEQIKSSQILLIGDFHALHQSQRAQMRILRQLPKDRKVVIAVEFFEAADQEKINSYLSGKMSEKEFLKAVQWQSKWGFPWEHYRPLMRWAQKHKISVYGINKSYKKRNATTLKSRDVYAGKKIAELVGKYPDHLVFAIYGDLHLAKSHIPQQIEVQLGRPFAKKILRIFQNAEQIFFQLLSREIEANTDLVRISQNVFCLMSVPPWVKWQNYLMYLEQAYDLELDEDDEDDEEYALDYTDHVGRYVKIISEELGLTVTLADLSVYTAQDSSFWTQLRENYDAKKLKWIEAMISERMSFYLPEIQAAYLARGTVNHAAALATRYIHALSSQTEKVFTDPAKDFLGLIWNEAVAYFGSKIINHKRKTDTIADIKSSLASRGPSDLGKEALQLALSQKMHELMVITGVPQHRLQARPRKNLSYLVAANLLGAMLGERLYGGYRKKLISAATIQSFLKRAVDKESFNLAYYDILEVIESLPAPFHSKREKL
ncbi:ChaN family lipoprotein [Bdellovibrio reynosensis]|uniref:ChaN family lipoprotein n=1 Tax=Bdellovibrio reynosensis TaxID=2835041 RepID=A0ABY4CB38_9BACT|nr:ChaN family lipoprotein [Bdellovibrio reynosensis]UOF01929.1 ChaN family lipoprotein [Bdellovibrio reynosensis]